MNAIRIFVLLFALTCAADAQVPMTGAGLGSGYAPPLTSCGDMQLDFSVSTGCNMTPYVLLLR